MAELAEWLREQLEARGLAQVTFAEHAGISTGMVSAILNKGYVPKVDILFRLADALDTDRMDVMFLAGIMRWGDGKRRPFLRADEPLTWEAVEVFRKVPAEYQAEVLEQMRWMSRVTRRASYRMRIAEGRELSSVDWEG